VSIVAIALLALLLGLAVAVVVLRRRRAVPVALEGVEPKVGPPPGGQPLPVVLVHGLFGFDRVGVPGARFDYFRGIVRHLESLGCHAHAVRLPAFASVPERARILVEKITALGHERVDIIAHSLGGLDARYALSRLGLATKVRSLVTVGTPHRGTPIADLASGAKRVIAALNWLSTSAAARFNEEVRDVPGVRYACVVGAIREKTTPIPLTLVPTHAYLRRVAGANDGIVPMSSQFWGETLAEIEADHFEQIGWRITRRGTFDALGLYAFVVARLGDAPAIAA